MGSEALQGVFAVATAIVGLAIIAVLVSRNANTAGVLSAGGGALSTAISAATAPVTGAASSFMSQGWTGSNPLDYQYE